MTVCICGSTVMGHMCAFADAVRENDALRLAVSEAWEAHGKVQARIVQLEAEIEALRAGRTFGPVEGCDHGATMCCSECIGRRPYVEENK